MQETLHRAGLPGLQNAMTGEIASSLRRLQVSVLLDFGFWAG
jgi:hypothetical protein